MTIFHGILELYLGLEGEFSCLFKRGKFFLTKWLRFVPTWAASSDGGPVVRVRAGTMSTQPDQTPYMSQSSTCNVHREVENFLQRPYM